MTSPYGPLRKSPSALAIVACPAVAMTAVAFWLVVEGGASVAEALVSPVVLICALVGGILLVWGAWFVMRPIVTLTPDGVTWPNGRTLAWAEVSAVDAGQTMSAVPSRMGISTVLHEVVTLSHGTDRTRITTTWAAIGPKAANARIRAAFDRSRST